MVTVLLAINVLAAQAGAPPPGQVAPPVEKCLHNTLEESPAERERRNAAMAAMRMIDWVRLQGGATGLRRSYWTVMANTDAVQRLKRMDGRVGELARRMAWGDDEPLPGWRIQFLDSWIAPAYSLTDTRDPCKLVYRSTDQEVLPPMYGVLPLEPR